MPGWAILIVGGVGVWVVGSALLVGLLWAGGNEPSAELHEDADAQLPPPAAAPASRRRMLLVDDDAALRLLLRTTLAADECLVEEAASAEEAAEIARFLHPSLVVLDVGLPGQGGLDFCHELKEKDVYGSPKVILLTGSETSSEQVRKAGADALLRKPFSPLDLLDSIDHVLEGKPEELKIEEAASSDQLIAYARDLSEIVQLERAQRRLLQHAYRQTIAAFIDTLEAKHRTTGHHAQRVHRYALELTEAVQPGLLSDPSLEYGFLLHDIGKIGIPDAVLDKAGPLSPAEEMLMRRHVLIGSELLIEVPLLDGEGLQVVRSHHERWDGQGYPDGLAQEEIPIGARIFAVADALDAMTTDRPYREHLSWEEAVDEILRESGSQFDPRVVSAFAVREQRLRRTQRELAQIA
jgi:ribonuclease P protein subunit RPR2